jgi:hypothetical protein
VLRGIVGAPQYLFGAELYSDFTIFANAFALSLTKREAGPMLLQLHSQYHIKGFFL